MADDDYDELQRTNDQTLSINTLVERYHNFQHLVLPFVVVVRSIAYIVRWKAPRNTLQIWVISLLLCLSADKCYLLLLCLAALIIVGALGWLCHINRTLAGGRHSQRSGHTHPSRVAPDAVLDESDRRDAREERQKRMLADCRGIIRDLLEGLVQACRLLEGFYSLLSWSSVPKSVIFYSSVALSLLSIFLFPLSLSLSLHVCLIFGANPGFLRFLQDLDTSSPLTSERRSSDTEPITTPAPKVECGQSAADSESRESLNTDDLPSGGSEKSTPDKCQEAGQKYPEKGECTSCLASFNNFTKRRRYCRYCGNHFCPKCCSKKLPRSAFGATSPVAKVEKELVCNDCWTLLSDHRQQLQDTPEVL